MDFLKKVSGGNNANNNNENLSGNQGTQSSGGGGGIMGRLNNTLGGGQSGEQKEGKRPQMKSTNEFGADEFIRTSFRWSG